MYDLYRFATALTECLFLTKVKSVGGSPEVEYLGDWQ